MTLLEQPESNVEHRSQRRNRLGRRDLSSPRPDDGALLRRHAPILRLDAREWFIPTDVDSYVEACSLWDRSGLVAESVTLADLDHRWSNGTHLRFIGDDDRRGLLVTDLRRTAKRMLSPRLGRVGLLGRILDAAFQLSVLIRPTTPRATAAAAAARARELGLQERPVCYGRAVNAGEWLVLHYAYFYVMNDWRTGYRGLNDHEADWEQAWIYCDPQTLDPVWIAASSHENRGDDLRRHWDDPELITFDGQPVLYPGAGSHAMFFRPGDYVSRIDIPALRWALRLQNWFRRHDVESGTRGLGPALGVPFIDTASGDGLEVSRWDLRLMRDDAPWVSSYRGLWGRDTGDPTDGERGPSGPKFDRSGEVRAAWADPLSVAGLHGTPPPSAAATRVNLDKIDRVLDDLDRQIRERGRLLPLARQTDSVDRMAGESERLTELLRQRCELEGLERRIQLGQANPEGIRDHLRHPAVPLASRSRAGWMPAMWAALSVPILLAMASVTLLFEPVGRTVLLPLGLAGALAADYLVERRFQAAFGMLAAQLSVIGLVGFFLGWVLSVGRYTLGTALILGSAILLAANTGELLSIRRARHRSRIETIST